MIRCRLRASLYNLLSGYNVLVSARKMVIPLTSVQSKWFQTLKQPLRTSTNDDDDFAELGLPVEKGGGVIPKLMTEKRDPFLRISGANKTLQGSSAKGDCSPAMKDVSAKRGNSSPISSQDIENKNHASCNFRTSSSVTIKNVPSIINLLQLKEAISVFGEVSKASNRSVLNGLDCCDIEFKSVDSRRMALDVGCLSVKNFNLPIYPLQSLETVTIRIRNISSMTADSAIHSTCRLCGPLEGLARMKGNVVDALFSVKSERDTKSILNKLNSIVMDESKWLAQLQHTEPPLVTMADNRDHEDDLGLKISEQLSDLKMVINLKTICVKDLEYLHQCLLHLENHPQGRNYCSNID